MILFSFLFYFYLIILPYFHKIINEPSHMPTIRQDDNTVEKKAIFASIYKKKSNNI